MLKESSLVSQNIQKNFASDNVTPACPEIMEALLQINHNNMASYGADSITERLNKDFSTLFETDVAVFPIATGTACNALALSAMVKPYGGIICDQSAHIDNDEGGAPEFFTNGAKIHNIPSPDGRMSPQALPIALERNKEKGVLAPPIQALSLTQATEWGTVYQPETLKELNHIAHHYNLLTHLDGARLGNALAHLHCSPSETTWKTGVDLLSFGGTKAGALAAEAVIVFLNERTKPLLPAFPHLLKRSGHLWSKNRFLSAQLSALLKDDLWLKNGLHANAMAERLAHALRHHPAAQLPFPVESNEVFTILPEILLQRLEEKGYGFYRQATPEGVSGVLVRFVTSFYTRPQDVDAFIEDLHA